MQDVSDSWSHVWRADIPPPGSANDYSGEPLPDAEGFSEPVAVPPPLPMLGIPQIMKMPRPRWLVKAVIAAGGLSIWYGAPGCGKSFLLTHMAIHLVLGIDMFGRKVRKGSVIYVAGEGAGGFRVRFEALQKSGLLDDATAPFWLIPLALDLVNPEADADRLLQAISAYPDVALVVVDTVARSLGGAEENDAGFGALIMTCDRIRMQTGAHVALIHHSGKDATRGPRGHSSLLGAADSAIEISRHSDGVRTATIVKQKDGIEEPWLTFDLQSVNLGTDDDGDPVTSCIVVEKASDRSATGRRKLAGQPAVAFHALEKLIAGGTGEPAAPAANIPAGALVVPVKLWRDAALKGGLSKAKTADDRGRAFHRSKVALVNAGLIGCREIDGEEMVWSAGHVRDMTET